VAQPARLGHLDDRAAAGGDREARLDRAPERVGDGGREQLGPQRGDQRVERALAAVAERQLDGVAPARA
jgi:hypothetical protein